MGAARCRPALHGASAAIDDGAAPPPEPPMQPDLLTGLLNIALYLLPIPVLLWADRPRPLRPRTGRRA
jgi:hypothetical protein